MTFGCRGNTWFEWNVALSNNLRGGAHGEFLQLIELLQNLPHEVLSTGPPRLRWRLDDKHGFSVNSYLSEILVSKFPGIDEFPSSVIWVSSAPTKVCSFTWQASLNSITTIDNLRRRGMIVPNRCALCYNSEESVSHLLLHCCFSTEVWERFRQTLGGCGPFPRDVLSLLDGWKDDQQYSGFPRFRKVLHHAIFWYLWIERNDRIFRDKSCSTNQLVWKIALNMSRWLKAHKKVS
ncbi:hypothetical protein LINGRAPRIM_LOCUS1168, partial [Linum grandiflorum]